MKTKSFQKQCDDYMAGELAYLGIHKDKYTGYVTATSDARYETLREYTLLEKARSKITTLYYRALNAVTGYGPKHPEYGTYSARDLVDMETQKRKWLATKYK
jgi:hypothetical protein